MIENTGKLIKKVAIISFCVEVGALFVAIIWAITKVVALANAMSAFGDTVSSSSSGGGTTVLWAFIGVLAVIAVLFVKNLLIYGFGELIENSAYTRANAEYISKHMVNLSDTADGVQFLCNNAIDEGKSLDAIYQQLAKQKAVQGQMRGSGTNIEWECPQCGTKNPLKAHFCMNCGRET